MLLAAYARPGPAKLPAGYLSVVATLVKSPVTEEPRTRIAAAIATATPEAIIAYSIAVAPFSSRRRRTTVKMVGRLFNIIEFRRKRQFLAETLMIIGKHPMKESDALVNYGILRLLVLLDCVGALPDTDLGRNSVVNATGGSECVINEGAQGSMILSRCALYCTPKACA
jgi:hypothetical protein